MFLDEIFHFIIIISAQDHPLLGIGIPFICYTTRLYASLIHLSLQFAPALGRPWFPNFPLKENYISTLYLSIFINYRYVCNEFKLKSVNNRRIRSRQHCESKRFLRKSISRRFTGPQPLSTCYDLMTNDERITHTHTITLWSRIWTFSEDFGVFVLNKNIVIL